MSEYFATVAWERDGARFVDNRYGRAHRWEFDGGAVVPASASPYIVPAPLSDPAAVDPEEAFVASIASCHMLFFLSFAAKRGLLVESYRDEAVGAMAKGADGRAWVATVTLRPHTVFAGEPPAEEILRELHDQAHHACFIANSVKTEIRVEPPDALEPG